MDKRYVHLERRKILVWSHFVILASSLFSCFFFFRFCSANVLASLSFSVYGSTFSFFCRKVFVNLLVAMVSRYMCG